MQEQIPNARNKFGITPLHSSSSRWDTEKTRVLLSAGANPNARTKKNKDAPLHSAWNAETTRILLNAGAES